MTRVKTLVVDDFEPFLLVVCALLQQRAELQVIAQASDGLEAVEKAQAFQPDLILLDVGLPKLNGIEAAKRVRKVAPNARTLIVSQESSPDVLQDALRSGAMGYVLKARVGRDLLTAIDAVLEGETYVSQNLKSGTRCTGRMTETARFNKQNDSMS